MNYDVSWKPEAEQDLTRLWLASRFRTDITQAANQIDALLADVPAEAGESRSKGRRVLLNHPLGVVFEIFESQKKVVVSGVWGYEKGRRKR